LSVYDGIPHLLAPVVTEPRKAVRRAQMDGARDGEPLPRHVEARRAQHRGLQPAPCRGASKGEVLMRRVQTGFDEGGHPVFEEQPLETTPLRSSSSWWTRWPTSCCGREGHRGGDPAPGADGARRRHPYRDGDAAPVGRRDHRHDQGQFPDPHQLPGHLEDRQPHHFGRGRRRAGSWAAATCSTWRAAAASPASTGPSSRTRKSRRWCGFRKSMGPARLPRRGDRGFGGRPRALWRDEEGGSGDQLYDQAVALVCRERKARRASCSAICRSAITAPRAIIERMETEGVVSAANHVGKREVLARKGD